MNRFKTALHAHAKKVFLNTNHSGDVVSVRFSDSFCSDLPAQLIDLEQSDLTSRNTGEYVENVYDVTRRLIVASDAFGFIPVMKSQIWVNDEAFIIEWVADREGLLYLDLSRPTM